MFRMSEIKLQVMTALGLLVTGATVPTSGSYYASLPATKWVVDGNYLGQFSGTVNLNLSEGKHRIKVKTNTQEVSFEVTADADLNTPEPVDIPAVVTPPTTVPAPAAPPVVVPAPTIPAAEVPAPTVGKVFRVGSRKTFLEALAAWKPGDTIVLTSSVNYGSTSADTKITSPAGVNADARVRIIADTGATPMFDRGSTKSGYALHLDRANYLDLIGVRIVGGSKGLMMDETNFARVESNNIGGNGMESLHLRNNSSDNIIRGNTIHDAGLVGPEYGEGIYVGTANNNWSASYSRTKGKPDKSDRNQILNNKIMATKAEAIDIKEGTTGGVVRGNVIDGASISGANNADSYIDVKGNDWIIEANVAKNPSTKVLDGFQTHILLTGWGNRNLFIENSVVGGGKTTSIGYNIQLSGDQGKSTGNKVYADNTATKVAKLSNIPVSE